MKDKEPSGYNRSFSREDLAEFKTDVSSRLAHKDRHRDLDRDEQLDLVIVVDQLLTGYDSKWVNTLYFDRVFAYDRLVQAFSRTNRVLDGHLKPFGSIVYFRKVHTMEKNIEDAFELYSDNQAKDVFVDQLPRMLREINRLFEDISRVFAEADVTAFEKLPDDTESRKKFAVAFSFLSRSVAAALIQGFDWAILHYDFPEAENSESVTVLLDKQTYDVLLSRYSELGTGDDKDSDRVGGIPLDLGTLAVAREAQRIDYEYMDAKFTKFREALKTSSVSQEEIQELLSQIQTAYASLSQEDQEVARMILTDLQEGRLDLDEDKTFRDYLNEYKADKQDLHVELLHGATGIQVSHIAQMLELSDGTEEALNAFNRLKDLSAAVDQDVFRQWLKKTKGLELDMFLQTYAVDQLLRQYFLKGGFDPADWDASKIQM